MKTSRSRVLSAAIGAVGVLAVVISVMAVRPDTLEPHREAVTEASRAVTRPLVSRPRRTTSEQVDRSQELVQELLRKVERLEALLADSGRSEIPGEAGERPAEGPEESRLEESFEAQEERVEAQIRAQIELLESTLNGELADGEWAKPAMIALGDAFQTESAEGFDLVEVDCRSSMCRVRLTFDPSLAEDSFRRLQSIVPWNGEGFFQVDDMDSGEAVLYLAREDHPLPQ